MKDQITRVQEALATERVAREILDERKSKEAKLLENNFYIDLNGEKLERKNTETRLNKLAEEKLFTIRLELTKEKKIREESDERNMIEFAD